jgi:PAS domain S-box-containing protein
MELEESEKKHRTVVESMHDMIFVLDGTNHFQEYFGPQDQKLLAPPDQFLNKHVREIMPKDVADTFVKLAEEVRNTIKSREFDYSLLFDGKLCWYTGTLSLHEDGKRIVLVVRDITLRKQAEEDKEEQLEFLENVLESLDHPFYVVDANDYTIKLANKAARLGNLEHNPTCHMLTHQKSTPCNEIDHPCPLQEVKRTREPFIVEHQHYDDRGNIRDVQIHAYPILDSDGEVIQMIEYSLDITEIKNVLRALEDSESRFREMYENLPMSYHSLDEEGHILEVNEQWLHTLNFTKEEVIGKHIGDFMTSRSRELLGPRFCAFKQDGMIYNLEFEMTRKDGSILIARFNGRIAYDENGNFKQTHCIFQDVTDLKIAEEIMKTKNTELSDLAHVMSHDLGNKMKTIHGLIKRYRVNQKEEVLERIDKLAEQATRLLKASARLADSGLVIEKKEMIDLSKLVSKIAETTIPDTVQYSQSDLPTVQGSPEKIGQIFQNLFENAIEHGNPELIEVVSEESKWGTVIFVRNDGNQIPLDTQDDIFKRGFSTKQNGTGLGLAIVRKLVEAHGWAIDLYNGSDRQTTFRISI